MAEEWRDAERKKFNSYLLSLKFGYDYDSDSLYGEYDEIADYWISRLSHQRKQVLDEAIEKIKLEYPYYQRMFSGEPCEGGLTKEEVTEVLDEKLISILLTLKNKDNE